MSAPATPMADVRVLRHRAGDGVDEELGLPLRKPRHEDGQGGSQGVFAYASMPKLPPVRELLEHVRKLTLRSWLYLGCIILGLLILTYCVICFLGDEALFVVYNHRAWELPVVRSYWFDKEMFAHTLKRGRLPGIDHIFISHYAPAYERKKHLTEALLSFGIDNFSFRDDWTRSRVLAEKELVAQRHFADAMRLKPGGKIFEALLGGTNVRVWEATGVKETVVDEPLLGRIANFMQHNSIWQEMVDRNMSAILVLEDDAVFHPAFRYEFELAMQELPRDYDILFVGGCMGRRAPRPNSFQITPRIHLVRQHRCANGYVLSRKAAEKMLAHPAPLALRNIDPFLEFLMRDVIPAAYWTEPPLVYEATKAFIPSYRSERSRCWFFCKKSTHPLQPLPQPPPGPASALPDAASSSQPKESTGTERQQQQ